MNVWLSTTFFIGAFVCIALLWWLYHRILSKYFVLNPLMVILNFSMLCVVILTLYFFESVVHLAAMHQISIPFINILIVSFALSYVLLGAMLVAGLVERRSELSADDHKWAVDQLASIAMSVPLAIGTIAFTAHHVWLGVAAIVLAVMIVILRRAWSPHPSRSSNAAP